MSRHIEVDEADRFPFLCANPECSYKCRVSLSGWFCGYCDPYSKLQNERQRMAIRFSYHPAAMPKRLRRWFGWDNFEYWRHPLPGVALADLKAARKSWLETISANEQLLAWTDRNSPAPEALAMTAEIAELQLALKELEAELDRRAQNRPFAGSVTFRRETYRPRMEPDYEENQFSYDYEWRMVKAPYDSLV
jgi:hypothetical protein